MSEEVLAISQVTEPSGADGVLCSPVLALPLVQADAFITDPIGELLASGAAFLLEHLDPLPAMLDSLAGSPGEIVAAVRSVACDLVADLVAKLIKWVAQLACTAGLGATWVVPDACAAVAEWVLHISRWLQDLVASIGRLGALAAAAQIEAWVAQAQRKARSARSLQASVEALEVTRRSPGGEVRVVVDHAGVLRDIAFSDGALDLAHPDLSRLIMVTLRQARAQLRESATRVAAEHGGSDDSLARSLTTEYRTVFAADGAAPG